MCTDITAGLAVRALNYALAKIIIVPRGQKEEFAAMLASLWDKALAKPTEKIKVEKRGQAVKGIDIAPNGLAAELDGLTTSDIAPEGG